MKSKQIVCTAVVLTLIFMLSSAAMARGFGRFHGPGQEGPEFGGLRSVMALNLSDTQRAQLGAIFEKYDATRTLEQENIMKAREELALLTREGIFDEQKVREAFRKVSSMRENLWVQRGKMFAEVRTVLTPEQIALMKEGRAERFEKMNDRREHRRFLWDQTAPCRMF